MGIRIGIRAAITPEYSLSLEEEQMAYGELDDTSAQIADDTSSMNRLLDISDTLEDVADIGEDIREASPIELALIKCTANMAVAGTDINSEKVINVKDTALESMVGNRIAVEDIRNAAVELWRKMIDFAKRIWESIVRFWKTYFGVGPATEKKSSKIKESLSEFHGKSISNPKLELKPNKVMFINGKIINTSADVIKHLKEFKDVMDAVYNKNLMGLIKLGNEIVKIIETTTFDNAVEKGDELIKLFSSSTDFSYLSGVYKNKANNVAIGDGFTATQTPDLFGNKRIVTKLLKLNAQPSVDNLEDVSRCWSKLIDSSAPVGYASLKTISFRTPTITDLETILDIVGVMGDIITNTHKVIDGDLTVINHKLESSCKKLADAWTEKFSKSSSMPSEDKKKLAIMKTVGQTYTTYNSLVHNPAIPFENLFRTVSNYMFYLVSIAKTEGYR